MRLNSSRRGFSMGELLIVLVIIGIVSAMVLPRLDFSRYQVDGGARVVRGALQQAQRAAIVKQHDVVVSFDAGGRRIRTLDDPNNNQQYDVGEHVSWRPLEDGVVLRVPSRGINGAVAKAVDGPGVRAVDGMPSVVFRSNGAASTDLEIYIAGGRKTDKEFRAVTLLQATGRTQWYSRSSGYWKEAGL
jgi:prepilin-type N-terminal cleavage/methylation domain-containing protein